MTPRLTSAMLVSAMIRRVGAEGGVGTVIAKGDASAGAIVLICMEKGSVTSVLERVLGVDGRYGWAAAGPTDPQAVESFQARRRNVDPDVWIVELDIPNAERFAAETIGQS